MFIETTDNIRYKSQGSDSVYRLKLFICLLFIITAGLPSAGLAATYYVDAVNGSDANPGSSVAPWRTLAKAKSGASYGDVVLLRDGNYGDFTETRTTTGTDWITYKADTGHTPVLDYVQIGSSSQISSDAYIELDGLTITNELRIYARNHINVKNCDIQNGSFTGNAVYGVWTATETPDHIAIENCEVHYAYRGINAGGDYWTIKNNNIHYIAEDGIHGGESNVLIEGNKIWDIDYRYGDPGIHSDGIQWVQTTPRENIIVRGNEFYGGWTNGGGALFISAGGGAWTNIRVENNLFYDLGGNILLIGGFDLYVHNNTVIKEPGVGGHIKVYDVAEMHNNIFSDIWSDGDVASHGNNIFGAVSGFTTEPTEEIVGNMNELFADAGNQDYRLAGGSTAINFGNPNYGPSIDILGNPRDAQPDAGCYEYQMDINDTTPPTPDPMAWASVPAATGPASITMTATTAADANSPPVRYYFECTTDGDANSDWQTNPTYLAQGLNPNTEYTFKVKARDNAAVPNETAWSTAESATTDPPDLTPPEPNPMTWATEPTTTGPYSITMTATTATDDNSPPVRYYFECITDGDANSDWQLSETYIAQSLDPNTEYTFKVKARDSATVPNETSWSDPCSATTSVEPPPSEDLVAHWKFDDDFGDGITDDSVGNNDGTLFGATQVNDAERDLVVSFDGANDYINIGAEDIGAPWTAVFWVKREDSSNTNAALLESPSHSLKSEQYRNTNKVGFTVYGVADYTFNYEAPIGSWVHLAFVATQTQITLYVDGVLTDTIDASASCPMGKISSASRPAKGKIDDVRLYNRALTEAEVLELFNASLVFEPIGNKEVDEGSELRFDVNTVDPNVMVDINDHNLPSDPCFFYNGGGWTFSWAPTYDDAGSYEVTFEAPHGEYVDFETITITVNNVNRQPLFTPAIGDKSVFEGNELRFTIGAIDPDGDPITYSAPNLPAGAAFSGDTFTWTPGYKQSGWYQVTFVASDGQDQDSETITITVKNQNGPPTIAEIGDKSVSENSLLSFLISATDPDDDLITYSCPNLPSGAVLTGETFTWTPTSGQAGVYEVTFVASDSQHQDSQTITISVVDFNSSDPTLVGSWLFDDDPADGALDSSQYGNDGYASLNGYPNLVPGKIGNAYLFDGVDDGVKVPHSPSLNVDKVTLSAWIYVNSYKNDQRIISKETGVKWRDSAYALLLSGKRDKRLQFRLALKGRRKGKKLTSNSRIPLNEWTHVAATFNGKYVRLYINGALDKKARRSKTVRRLRHPSKPVYIGGSQFYNRHFDGKIDDVRIYNKALRAAEIRQLWEQSN